MHSKGYDFEAQYITVVWNWRRACDERVLSELQRCRYNNNEFLNLVLDDLMPWHKENYDFCHLEVNRYFCVLCLFKHGVDLSCTTPTQAN